MKKTILPSTLLILAILLAFEGFCQTRYNPSEKQINTERYTPADIVFNQKKQPEGNPFDITFGAVFTAPDSSTLHIPGFYNDENEYVIRFSPTQTGRWSYQTYASVPQLSGIQGSLTVGENTNPDVHGAITVSAVHPQKFEYEDGTSYFALAFELDWLFALDYGNEASIPKTEQIISEVKANGFNQIVMNVYAYDVGWKVAEDVPQDYQYGKLPPLCHHDFRIQREGRSRWNDENAD